MDPYNVGLLLHVLIFDISEHLGFCSNLVPSFDQCVYMFAKCHPVLPKLQSNPFCVSCL